MEPCSFRVLHNLKLYCKPSPISFSLRYLQPVVYRNFEKLILIVMCYKIFFLGGGGSYPVNFNLREFLEGNFIGKVTQNICFIDVCGLKK